MNLNNIPQEMKDINNWVLWKLDNYKNKNGEITKRKVPYQINKKMAKVNEPSTWSSYKEVAAVYKKNGYSGIGFMFSNSGITGIDIDHCISNGKISDEATNIIELLDSFTETSQSGTGIHIYAKGIIPLGLHQEIEMYCCGRYFAITGDSLNDKKVEPRQKQISALYEKHKKVEKAKKVKIQAPFPKPKDIEQITKCLPNSYYKDFESDGTDTRFIKTFPSMKNSKAWGELTLKQWGLYDLLKSKYTKVNGKFNENDISIPKSEWIKYYSRKSAFDTDIDNLINLGFIKVILYRGKMKKSTIYGYSAQWKHYGTDLFNVTNKDRRPKDTLTAKHKKAISIITKKNLAKRYTQRDKGVT